RDPSAGNRLAGAIAGLVRTAGMPSSLEACDVDPALIPQMAGEAAKQWTGAFNPRPVDATSLEELYRCAFSRCD
ncbi:MAG TPA: alcohol dehydrogenase, partial [Planctomycetaceae bacterium]|nr:alcohol dehydrogenase [Planctomycetaceae bacterium]